MTYVVKAYLDTDKVWTIEAPSLTSDTPTGEPVPATGASLTWEGVESAALDLIAAWTGDDSQNIKVTISA